MSYWIIERPLANGGKAAIGRADDSENPDAYGIVRLRFDVAEKPEDVVKFADELSALNALDVLTDIGQLPSGVRFKEIAWNAYPSEDGWGVVEVKDEEA